MMPSAKESPEMLAGGVIRDLQRVNQDRRGLWLAGVLELSGLLVFVGFFNLLAPNVDSRLSDWQLIAVGLLLSLVPAGLWLLFFYHLDRLEPEPKRKLVDIFLIAGLLTAGLAYPLLHVGFDIESWMYEQWWTELWGGILVVGVVNMLVVFLSIRYGIYFDKEFDERVDGVIYGTAAGLGVATVLNFIYIFQHNGVDLDVGSMRMVINALAFASFAGILGYCMGQTRFEKTPFYYLPSGFMLAAALNGLFFFLEDQVSWQGLQDRQINGLVLAMVFALVTLLMLFWLVRRANEETLRLSRGATPEPVAVRAATAAPPAARQPARAAAKPTAPPPPAPTSAASATAPPTRPVSRPLPRRQPPAPPPASPLKSPAFMLPSDPAQDAEADFPNAEEILADVKSSWLALLEDLQEDNTKNDDEEHS